MAKAVVGPDGKVCGEIQPKVVAPREGLRPPLRYVDQALLGTAKTGTTAWKFIDFPLDKVQIRSKTGSAEVYGKQSTSWVASYDKQYVVLMMVTQAGTGSGTSGPAVRKIWEALYGINGMKVDKRKRALPDATPPAGLPVFARDGEILPPMARAERKRSRAVERSPPRRGRGLPRRRGHHPGQGRPARLGADARRRWPCSTHRLGAGLVGHRRPRRPHRRRPQLLPASKQLVNIAIGVVLCVMVTATDHRWVRILAPLVYVASVVGLVLVLVMGSHDQRLPVVDHARRPVDPAGGVRQAGRGDRHGAARRRAHRGLAAHPRGRPASTCSGCSLIAGLPALLILLQPDLGTMLVLSATVFGVIAVSGAPRVWLAGLAGGAVVAAVAAVQLGVLKSYQVDRFLAFIDPTLDPRGAGYNTTQARIAIGNGGVFGQGLFGGSQTKSGFVPEQHTDFIFTVAGEELGLVGSAVLIALLGVVLWRALTHLRARRRPVRPARRRRDRLLVRLPGLPEHRHVPGHHAGHRRAAAAGVVRRLVDVRHADGAGPAAEHPPAQRDGHRGGPFAPGALALLRASVAP